MTIITKEQAVQIHREVIRAQLFECADITRKMQVGGIFMTREELLTLLNDAVADGVSPTFENIFGKA